MVLDNFPTLPCQPKADRGLVEKLPNLCFPVIPEAEIFILAKDNVVKHGNPEYLPRLKHQLCYLSILIRRLNLTGRMIMTNNNYLQSPQ